MIWWWIYYLLLGAKWCGLDGKASVYYIYLYLLGSGASVYVIYFELLGPIGRGLGAQAFVYFIYLELLDVHHVVQLLCNLLQIAMIFYLFLIYKEFVIIYIKKLFCGKICCKDADFVFINKVPCYRNDSFSVFQFWGLWQYMILIALKVLYF